MAILNAFTVVWFTTISGRLFQIGIIRMEKKRYRTLDAICCIAILKLWPLVVRECFMTKNLSQSIEIKPLIILKQRTRSA